MFDSLPSSEAILMSKLGESSLTFLGSYVSVSSCS